MKIHFSWTISANPLMELQSKIMIKSTNGMDCHNTIWVQKHEYTKISSSLKKMAEILPYKPNSALLEPWATTPKWNIDPQGDIIIGTDADVMVWNQNLVIQEAEKCLKDNQICGTIGYASPFNISDWEKLFTQYNMKDEFFYQTTNTKEKTPYYINNGVVMMPKELLQKFKEYYQKWLIEINKWHYNLYYMCQVATTFAIKDAELPVKAMSRYFNYTEVDNPELPNLDEAIFLHYNITRNYLSNIQNEKIRTRFFDLIPKIKLL